MVPWQFTPRTLCYSHCFSDQFVNVSSDIHKDKDNIHAFPQPTAGPACGARFWTLHLSEPQPKPRSPPPTLVRLGFRMNRTGAVAMTMTEIEMQTTSTWRRLHPSCTLTTWPRRRVEGGVEAATVTTSITWTPTLPPSRTLHKRWRINWTLLRWVCLQMTCWWLFLCIVRFIDGHICLPISTVCQRIPIYSCPSFSA